MPVSMQKLIDKYVLSLQEVYGSHLRQVILYGSYARGDFNEESDIDIMVLVDLSDLDIKDYRHQLTDITFEYNMDYDLEIKPVAKNIEHYYKWLNAYPFYANVNRDGVTLYAA